MIKVGCGGFMVLFGAILAIWIVFNLFVSRQAEFKFTVGGILFMIALFGVGIKWIMDGLPDVQEKLKPKRRSRKRRRRDEDEDE